MGLPAGRARLRTRLAPPAPHPRAARLPQVKPGHMSRQQLVATAFLLLVAGNATVAGMINLGVVTLLQHSEQLDKLKVGLLGWG